MRGKFAGFLPKIESKFVFLIQTERTDFENSMIKSLGNSTSITIATFIFLSFPGSGLRAERKIHQSSTGIARDLSRNVYEIDILADQMAFKYSFQPEQAYPRLTDVTVNQSIEKTRRG